MIDSPSARASAWSPVPWQELPARFREAPDQWPQPQRRSVAELLCWRAAVIVGCVLLAVFFMPSPPPGVELTGVQLVVLWYALALAVFYGVVFVVAIARPSFPGSSRIVEVIRKIRAARRETLRAIRRGEPIPPERTPLARLWIAHDRAGTGPLAQQGLLFTVLLMGSVDRPSLMTVAPLVGVTVLLGVLVERLRRERAIRRWESAHGSVDGDG